MTLSTSIRVDVFPAAATVTIDGVEQTYSNSRVIVTQDQAYVFIDSSSGPTVAHTGRLDSFEGRNTVGYTAVLADDSTITFRRGGGCGCGSRLRGFRPFTIMTQGQTVV